MAAFTKIETNVIYNLKHNHREAPKASSNTDIDSTKSHLNYQLSPKEHGTTSGECKRYFNKRMNEVQHIKAERLITSCEWVISAPKDLAPEQQEAFFRESYNYLTSVCGGEKACINATVHVDEKVKDIYGNQIAGANHLHYTFIPEVKNNKYISLMDKVVDGLTKTQNQFSIEITKEKAQSIYATIKRYEKSNIQSAEKDAIRKIGEILDLKRDDARWVFTRTRRTPAQRFEKKVCVDQLITKQFLKDFHPGLQKHLDSCGIRCTVFSGNKTGKEINLSTAQLKELTRQTGVVLEKSITIEDLSKLITENRELHIQVKELEEKIQSLEQRKEVNSSWGQSHEWGAAESWGKNNRGNNTWQREY